MVLENHFYSKVLFCKTVYTSLEQYQDDYERWLPMARLPGVHIVAGGVSWSGDIPGIYRRQAENHQRILDWQQKAECRTSSSVHAHVLHVGRGDTGPAG